MDGLITSCAVATESAQVDNKMDQAIFVTADIAILQDECLSRARGSAELSTGEGAGKGGSGERIVGGGVREDDGMDYGSDYGNTDPEGRCRIAKRSLQTKWTSGRYWRWMVAARQRGCE